jgi:hypothetical protein
MLNLFLSPELFILKLIFGWDNLLIIFVPFLKFEILGKLSKGELLVFIPNKLSLFLIGDLL